MASLCGCRTFCVRETPSRQASQLPQSFSHAECRAYHSTLQACPTWWKLGRHSGPANEKLRGSLTLPYWNLPPASARRALGCHWQFPKEYAHSSTPRSRAVDSRSRTNSVVPGCLRVCGLDRVSAAASWERGAASASCCGIQVTAETRNPSKERTGIKRYSWKRQLWKKS